jgi:hypothetical protein
MSGSAVASAISSTQFVDATGSVVSAGGSNLALNGFLNTTNTRVPIGSVYSFPNLASVGSFFGTTSLVYQLAGVYFAGFTISNIKPAALLIQQYPWTSPVSAYVRGANVSGLALTTVHMLAGYFSVTVDGVTYSAANVNLSTATSLSNAAQIMNTALAIPGAAVATITGSIATTTLTVTAGGGGLLGPGQLLTGASIVAGTYIVQQLSGTTGSTGTYQVNISQTVASESIAVTSPAVTYDSLSGGFVITSASTGSGSSITYPVANGVNAVTLLATLGLTQTTGAVISQGSAIYAPASAMYGAIAVTTNFTTFMTDFEPVLADKVSFAQWASQQNNTYIYSMWDTNAVNATTVPATGTAWQAIQAALYSGTIPNYSDINLAAAVMGAIASLNPNQLNGIATLFLKQFSGVTPSVTTSQASENLIANGFNFYGLISQQGIANSVGYANGTISGPYAFIDAFVGQVILNNGIAVALLQLLQAMKTVPYNSIGYTEVMEACQVPITQALNFGAISAGVTLSTQQASEVNNAAGVAIDSVLSTRGWYLQVVPATAAIRGARTSPQITLWYMYAGSVQQLNLSSILVQ